MRILYTYLDAFSRTGGIENFNKCFCKAFSENEAADAFVVSMYDKECDAKYLEAGKFKGFGNNKLKYAMYVLLQAYKYDVIIFGHINLAVIGYIIKTVFPRKKIYLITHGIEVWGGLNSIKSRFLKKADKILTVSNFTANKLETVHNVSRNKISIFPNAIDPYFIENKNRYTVPDFKKGLGIAPGTKVILTVTRLSSTEHFKGYDNILAVLPEVMREFPGTVYLLVGKYDETEYNRIITLVKVLGIEGKVMLKGYVSNEDLVNYYQSSDVFVMPSKKEGFGIVYIEAILCGLAVIAGNKDGSVEALMNGELGTLIDPDDKQELRSAIMAELQYKTEKGERAGKVLENFGFDKYKERLNAILKQDM